MTDSNINKVIEEFSHLPQEEKEYVAEIFRKQVIGEYRGRKCVVRGTLVTFDS